MAAMVPKAAVLASRRVRNFENSDRAVSPASPAVDAVCRSPGMVRPQEGFQAGHDVQDVRQFEGLGHEVEGAFVEGLLGRFQGGETGDDDDADLGRNGLDAVEEADAVETFHLEVGDDDVGRGRFEGGQGGGTVGEGLHLVAGLLEGGLQAFDHDGLVVEDQKAPLFRGIRAVRCCHGSPPGPPGRV